MGQQMSEEEKERRQEEQDRLDAENFVNDPRYIAWDDNGNLRYGMIHPVHRNQQKLEILKLDFVDNEDGKVWYIMDSAWIGSWLAYVHFDIKNAPAPGPCSNHRLISYDYNENKWVFRWGLMMAIKDRGGDYRRVSEEVWRKFCEFFPGSGPAITMTYSVAENQNGFFPSALFTIVDVVPDPEDKDKRKKKKKKKKFTALFAKEAGAASESKDAGESKGEVPESKPGDTTALLKESRARDSDDDSDTEGAGGSDLATMLKSSNPRTESKKQTPIKSRDSDADYEKVFGFTT